MGHNFICILCTCKSGFNALHTHSHYTHTLQLNTQRRDGSKAAEMHETMDAKANADFEMSEEGGGGAAVRKSVDRIFTRVSWVSICTACFGEERSLYDRERVEGV